MSTFKDRFIFKFTLFLERSFEITLEMVRINTSNCPPRFSYVGVGVHRRALTEEGIGGVLPIGGGVPPNTKTLLIILYKYSTFNLNCKEKSVFFSIKIASFFSSIVGVTESTLPLPTKVIAKLFFKFFS